MELIKDYCLVLLLLFYACLIFRYCRLKKELFTEKEIFVKTLGHDFGVPIISQIRGLSLLKKSAGLSSDEREMLQYVDESCKYTLDMINMLKKIYEYENGVIQIKHEKIITSELLSEVLKSSSEIASERGVKLKFDTNIFEINTDRENLHKLLSILTKTAVEYSRNDKEVNITLKNSAGKLLLNVEYEGIPLSEEEKKRMLTRDPNFSTVGHGIQMYLCKKIVNLLKGKIEFKSDIYNRNSFKVTLPKKRHTLGFGHNTHRTVKNIFNKCLTFFNKKRVIHW